MEGSREYIASTVARVSVRPAAIAYVVRLGDREGFLRAVAYACTEWGGGGQPIVPIGRRLRVAPLYEDQVQFLRPEAVIDFADLDDAEVAALESRWDTKVFRQSHLKYFEPGAPVGITADTNLSHRTLFESPGRASLAMKVALGVLMDEQRSAWGATNIAFGYPETSLELVDSQVDKPSPVSATRWDFEAFESQAFYAPVTIFCWPTFTLSLANYFWNIRAAGWANGHHVLWLAPKALRDPGVAARLRELALARQLQSQPDLLLIGPIRVDLAALAEAAGFVEMDPGTKSLEVTFGAPARDIGSKPLTYLTRRHPARFLFGERKVGRITPVQVTVAKPTTVIDFESPFEFRRRGGSVRVDVNDDYFRWPRSSATARLLNSDAYWTPYGLTVAYEPSQRYQVKLAVPDGAQVASAFLGEKGWTWSLSDKGRYAQALDDPAHRRRPLITVGELALVRNLTSLSRKKAEQAMRAVLGTGAQADAVVEAAGNVLPALVPRWRTSGEIAGDVHVRREQVIDTLEDLVADRLVRRAFRFECPRCGLQSSVLLDRADDHIPCEGCGSTSTLRGPAGSEPPMVYSVSTLLDRVMDQDCLGHLLVEAWVRTHRDAVWSVPGANLSSRGTDREMDLLAISRAQLIVAEVKNSASGFSEPAVDGAAGLARDLGAGRLVLATLDRWPQEDAAAARSRAAATFAGDLDILSADDLIQ